VIALEARRAGSGVELRWTDSTTRATTFYRVYRSTDSGGFPPDAVCERRGVDQCELRSETLVTTREHGFFDAEAPEGAVYRVGVAANWLDDPSRGDVFAVSPPVVPSG